MSYQIYLKSLKVFFMNKFLFLLKTLSQNIRLVSEKASIHCLVTMTEKIKKSLGQRGEHAALLKDLSEAFDCLPHDLMIAKLHAYRFEKASLRLMHSYLTDRYQRIKINIPIAFAVSLNMGCFKVQFWVPYYLIYFYVICSL